MSSSWSMFPVPYSAMILRMRGLFYHRRRYKLIMRSNFSDGDWYVVYDNWTFKTREYTMLIDQNLICSRDPAFVHFLESLLCLWYNLLYFSLVTSGDIVLFAWTHGSIFLDCRDRNTVWRKCHSLRSAFLEAGLNFIRAPVNMSFKSFSIHLPCWIVRFITVISSMKTLVFGCTVPEAGWRQQQILWLISYIHLLYRFRTSVMPSYIHSHWTSRWEGYNHPVSGFLISLVRVRLNWSNQPSNLASNHLRSWR